MAGWESLGQIIGSKGNRIGNELAYAKGASLGANTELALAKARESVATEQARSALGAQLAAAGLDQSLADASVGALTAGGKLGDVIDLQKGVDERHYRATAADPNVPFAIGNRALMGVASAPISRFDAAGAGILQDKLSNEAPIITPLGQAAIHKDESAALLDDEKRLHPERFQSPSATRPQIVDMGGIKYMQGVDANGAATWVPVIDRSQQVTNAVDTTAGKAVGKTVGTNTAALQTTLNTFDTMGGNVDKLIADPNFNDVYGANVGQVTRFVPGSGSARASGIREQLGSEAFTVSVQKMRGLGQLSNAEGQKVQSALTRALDPMLDPKDARVAWGDFKIALANLRKVAIQEAGGEDKLSTLLGDQASSAPAASAPGGAYADPAKEARYQAWKAAQGLK